MNNADNFLQVTVILKEIIGLSYCDLKKIPVRDVLWKTGFETYSLFTSKCKHNWEFFHIKLGK